MLPPGEACDQESRVAYFQVSQVLRWAKGPFRAVRGFPVLQKAPTAITT
jgi:hypothetical protein